MTTDGAGLTSVATADLERLVTALRRGDGGAVTRAALAAGRLGHLWDPISTLGVTERAAVAAVARAVLAERRTHPPSRVDLVWTGAEAKTGYGRPTSSVVRELFEAARAHVLIAGYSFDHGAEILEPLHAAMAERAVVVDLYLHVQRARRATEVEKHLEGAVASFFAQNWTFGTPHPTIYVAPRTLDPSIHESLHAKCVVVDELISVVGSANFTGRGHSRNIEVGARIHDRSFAQSLVAQFRAATHAGVFRPYGGGTS